VLSVPNATIERPPGGDGSIEATARREVAEGVGLDVGAVEYVHSRTSTTDGGTDYLNVVTLCEYEGGEPHCRTPAEVTAVRWLSLDEVRAHPDAPDFLVDDVERIETLRRAGRE
jgi:8-oxo-dGTP diphosphatase